MQDKAVQNGVQVIGLRKYLDMIGYRLPRPPEVTGNPADFRLQPGYIAPARK
jgi:hypothetical protein